jgi:hypothetical protein
MISLLAINRPARGADGIDYGALVHDLEKIQKSSDKITVVLWMPEEFWKSALASNGRFTPKGIDDYLVALRPYTLIAVVDSRPAALGGLQYTDDDTLMNSVRVEDSNANLYQPMPLGLVSDSVRNMVDLFRPLMRNMMGAMGEHMVFLVFPAADKSGQRFAYGAGSGALTVHVGDVALRYRLPLESLFSPSVDPKTAESFPSTYRFNPYTGAKLTQGQLIGPASPPGDKLLGNWWLLCELLRSRSGGATRYTVYGPAHAIIGPAAADIAHGIVDVGVAGARDALEQRHGGQDHARLTVATLRDAFGNPGLLHRVVAMRGQTLDRQYRLASDCSCVERAGSHRRSLHQHGAGPAQSLAAAELRPRQAEFVAQHPQQRRVGIDVDLMVPAVDGDFSHSHILLAA